MNPTQNQAELLRHLQGTVAKLMHSQCGSGKLSYAARALQWSNRSRAENLKVLTEVKRLVRFSY
jgi:hypothetical protein